MVDLNDKARCFSFFSPVYDEEVMHKIGTNYNLLRLDRAKDKTTFLEKHGSKCQTLIINGHTELNQTHVNNMPNLKLVVCSSAGYELMDTTTLQNRNIKLTNTAAALFDDVADMAILMILASMRNLVRGHDYVASQRWAEKGMFPLQSSLKGKHLGLVGFGKIGQAIAKRAAVFGPNIAYHSRSKTRLAAFIIFLVWLILLFGRTFWSLWFQADRKLKI